MPTTITTDDGDIGRLLHEIANRNCHRLIEEGVTFEVQVATNEDGPALKKFGVGVPAIVKVNNTADRVAGCQDVRVTVDEQCWNAANEMRRQAILHGLLIRLELKFDQEGRLKRDDNGRPCVKILPLDFLAGGMDEIAFIYGKDAPEYKVWAALGRERRSEQEAAA